MVKVTAFEASNPAAEQPLPPDKMDMMIFPAGKAASALVWAMHQDFQYCDIAV